MNERLVNENFQVVPPFDARRQRNDRLDYNPKSTSFLERKKQQCLAVGGGWRRGLSSCVGLFRPSSSFSREIEVERVSDQQQGILYEKQKTPTD